MTSPPSPPSPLNPISTLPVANHTWRGSTSSNSGPSTCLGSRLLLGCGRSVSGGGSVSGWAAHCGLAFGRRAGRDSRGSGLRFGYGGCFGCLRLLASGVGLALELAGGAGAVNGAVALPIAIGRLAHALAKWVGVVAEGVAHGLAAHRSALGAAPLLALVRRAAHLAVGLGALDFALGAGKLLTASGATRCLANGLAHLQDSNHPRQKRKCYTVGVVDWFRRSRGLARPMNPSSNPQHRML